MNKEEHTDVIRHWLDGLEPEFNLIAASSLAGATGILMVIGIVMAEAIEAAIANPEWARWWIANLGEAPAGSSLTKVNLVERTPVLNG